jgi:hypothetical protein
MIHCSCYSFFLHSRSLLQLPAAETLGVSSSGAEASSLSRQMFDYSELGQSIHVSGDRGVLRVVSAMVAAKFPGVQHFCCIGKLMVHALFFF